MFPLYSNAMKQIRKEKNSSPVTKNDITDMQNQLLDGISGKLLAQEKNILDSVDTQLANQKKAIVKDVAEYIADVVVPLLDKQNRKFTKIEHHMGISLAESVL